MPDRKVIKAVEEQEIGKETVRTQRRDGTGINGTIILHKFTNNNLCSFSFSIVRVCTQAIHHYHVCKGLCIFMEGGAYNAYRV